MISYEVFRETIELLENNQINYWVFGGFALDGMRGKITREHGDIDIYLHPTDLKKVIKLFSSNEFKYTKREKMHFIDSNRLKLGIVILTEEGNSFVANGNKTLAKYPKEIFLPRARASIRDTNFSIVPNEVLFLESTFSKFDKDKSYGSKLKFNQKLFDKIEIIKIRDSRSK